MTWLILTIQAAAITAPLFWLLFFLIERRKRHQFANGLMQMVDIMRKDETGKAKELFIRLLIENERRKKS